MNDKQKAAKDVLQNELLKQRGIKEPLPDYGESKDGYSFTEVERVTVIIGPRGGLILPSVRHYKNALQAAVNAGDAFRKNMGGQFDSGHDSGIVRTDWRCDSPGCVCQTETYDQRFRRSVFIGRRS